jgi:hypothetical protein
MPDVQNLDPVDVVEVDEDQLPMQDTQPPCDAHDFADPADAGGQHEEGPAA